MRIDIITVLPEMLEGFVKRLYKEILNVDIPTPLPRLSYTEAMNRYGSDKPDTRFGMEIQDITEMVKDIDFVVFSSAIEGGGSVRAINVKGGAATYTRKEIDKMSNAEFARYEAEISRQVAAGLVVD